MDIVILISHLNLFYETKDIEENTNEIYELKITEYGHGHPPLDKNCEFYKLLHDLPPGVIDGVICILL